MNLTYLGQAGILLEGKNSTILIDPYLSNYVVEGGYGDATLFKRNFPPPIPAEKLPRIDVVFITHDHADHCDLPTLETISSLYPQCWFVGPISVRKKLLKYSKSPKRLQSPLTNVVEGVTGLEFRPIPAAHYEVERDPKSGEFLYLGYLINHEGMVLYHAGDTILHDQLIATILSANWDIDVACLPVNGRDKQRDELEIVGNLRVEEAISLTSAIKSRILVPLHNDLFTINQDDPEIVRKALSLATDFTTWQLSPGEIRRVK